MKIQQGRPRRRCSPARTRARRATSSASSPTTNKVIVDGVNVAKKHQKADAAPTMQGGIIDKDMPIDVSQRGHVCVARRQADPRRLPLEGDGTKVRVCQRSAEVI